MRSRALYLFGRRRGARGPALAEGGDVMIDRSDETSQPPPREACSTWARLKVLLGALFGD
ncbi:MAG: hypothetical protein AMXMBFR34_06670 [Myxococcaceae bacterium]